MWGNWFWRLIWPHQMSCQNRILSPFPTTQFELFNTSSLEFRILFQRLKPKGLLFTRLRSVILLPNHLRTITFFHRHYCCSGTSACKALLRHMVDLMPKPPDSKNSEGHFPPWVTRNTLPTSNATTRLNFLHGMVLLEKEVLWVRKICYNNRGYISSLSLHKDEHQTKMSYKIMIHLKPWRSKYYHLSIPVKDGNRDIWKFPMCLCS